MGVNNRARRAEKRRKRANDRATFRNGARSPHSGPYERLGPSTERLLAASLVDSLLAEVQEDRAAAGRCAELLTNPPPPVTPAAAARSLAEILRYAVVTVVRNGWAPSDLGQLCQRRLTPRHLPPLAALLATEAAQHPRDRVAGAWLDDLRGLGTPEAADLRSPRGLELALGLCVVLSSLPAISTVIPPPGAQTQAHPTASSGAANLHAGAHSDAKVLAKVRSLLAKAESTEFSEEAEALSAKAQELISRYALHRLVDEPDPDATTVVGRRLWIDAPYVLPKAMLIAAVARANRCESVVSDQLGFTTVIGETADLEAVELLATSLQLQADTAMLRYGRQADSRGMSRTTSFRRSFLVAYASRIGERLARATEQAAQETGRRGELVPVLRRQSERVEAARDRLFPQTTARETAINNARGWAAGRAAADLALLDTSLQLPEAVS